MTEPLDERWLAPAYWLGLLALVGVAMLGVETLGRYVLGLVAWCWSLVG